MPTIHLHLSLGGANCVLSVNSIPWLDHIFAPCVIRENNKIKMWFNGGRGYGNKKTYNIYFATSKDGLKFSNISLLPIVRLNKGFSALTPAILRTANGKVLREHGKYRLWFSEISFAKHDRKYTLHEIVCQDGLHCSKPSPTELTNVYAPSVIKDGSEYRMWYVDPSVKHWVIRSAISKDGKYWHIIERPTLVVSQQWERGRLIYPYVMKLANGTYIMFYTSYFSKIGKTAIGIATSRNGIIFKKYKYNPIIKPNGIAKNLSGAYVSTGSVVALNKKGWYRIYYSARPIWNGKGKEHKYFAICTTSIQFQDDR
ncbi:MAG: hypothetical protein PVI75_02285 [Gammaproteobacteria bacterium]|jgi:predicted GH43/DUF377 family glycosyl hydrolase